MTNSLEIKRNIFEHVIYEFVTDFDNLSTLLFIQNNKVHNEEGMLTTFQTELNIIFNDNLKDLREHIERYIEVFTVNILKKKSYKILRSWLQAYRPMDVHGLHTHETTLKDYSLIFYIQCSDNSSKTVFYAPGYPYIESLEIQISPEKSKFVIFPGSTPHEVRPNKDDQRIIFSCNFQVD